MPRIRRSKSTASRRNTPSTSSDLNQLTTGVLRHRFDQLKLSATGSRQTLLARLRAAPQQAVAVNPPNLDPEQTDTATDRPTTTPTEQEPPTTGFTAEQYETLQSTISSSIRDATAQQQTSTAVSSELVVPGPTPSFPPHLPTKTISSIRNGEYIDFNYLLSENIDGHDEHLKISFDALGSGFSIPVSMSQHKRQRIDSIERWLNAFNIFARVVVHFFPYKASELFVYQQAIRDAPRKFSGMAWYAYDIAFRKKAANDASISWAHRDPQLYLEKFTGLAKTACHVCGSADHFVNACPIAPTRSMQRSTDDRCRNYNRKVPCFTNPCPFKHRCNRPGCAGHHPALEHDARAAESSSNKRDR